MSEPFLNFSSYADISNKCVRFIYKAHLSYVFQSVIPKQCTWLTIAFFFFKEKKVYGTTQTFLDLSFYLYLFA